MQLKSNALPDLIWRLRPAIDPATRFFLVALFIVGFTSSYFGDLRSKTHPQYAANADVFSRTRAGTIYVRNVGNAPGSKLGNVASASLNGLSPRGCSDGDLRHDCVDSGLGWSMGKRVRPSLSQRQAVCRDGHARLSHHASGSSILGTGCHCTWQARQQGLAQLSQALYSHS